MQYMVPTITSTIICSYEVPFTSLGAKRKVSIGRFAHIMPGFTDEVYRAQKIWAWRLMEGLLGVEKFMNINQQARLVELDVEERKWWAESGPGGQKPNLEVMFREDNLLLRDFKGVLERMITDELQERGV